MKLNSEILIPALVAGTVVGSGSWFFTYMPKYQNESRHERYEAFKPTVSHCEEKTVTVDSNGAPIEAVFECDGTEVIWKW